MNLLLRAPNEGTTPVIVDHRLTNLVPQFMSGQKTILVADDDSNDIFLLNRAFLKAGVNARIQVVRDGEQAIRYLKGEFRFRNRDENPLPELFLLDLKMPRVDGFEVLEWVRKQPGLKRMLIIVLTSSDEPKDINRAYDLGANSYVVKPCGMEHLVEIVGQLQNYWLNVNRSPSCTTDIA